MITISLLHATWCAPCKMFEPKFEKISKDEKYSSLDFRTYDIDSDEGFKICEIYHIKSVPTTLITAEDGTELYKIIGNASIDEVTKMIDLALEKEPTTEKTTQEE